MQVIPGERKVGMRKLKTSSAFIAAAALLMAACGSKTAPDLQPPAAGLQEDFSSTACLFGSMRVGSSRGYECVDGEFRAWIDNDQDILRLHRRARSTKPTATSGSRSTSAFSPARKPEPTSSAVAASSPGIIYYFRLGADGSSEITNYLEGEEQVARMFPPSDGSIQPGWNHLRADCIGGNLSFYVNGELVLERTMDGNVYESGDIGLGAGGGSLGFSEVRFDNLSVTQP